MIECTNRIIYTADDEMPDCGKCDNCCGDFNCTKYCGADHGWYGYQRSEYNKNLSRQEIKNNITNDLGENL